MLLRHDSLCPSAKTHSQDGTESKGGLDAPHVILIPVPLCWLLLPDWYSLPVHAHDSDSVDIILLELDLERTVVVRRPLGQSPFLLNVGGPLKLHIRSRDITAEDLEFGTLVCTLEYLRRGARESCNALWICESLEQLLGSRAKLLLVGELRCVDHRAFVGRCCRAGSLL